MLDKTLTSDEKLPWTDEEIRQLCGSHSSAVDPSGCPYVHVGQYFIKWGMAVRFDEALAQQYVWAYSNGASFRVPEVYYYFEDEASPLTCGFRCGYLVMEFVEGGNDSGTGDAINSQTLRQVLLDLWAIPIPSHIKIGPFGGSRPQGYLWADDGAPLTFDSVERMERFMDQCLRISSRSNCPDSVDLSASHVVICHGDLARRNLRLSSNGALFVLDWANAGVYPSVLECFAIDYLIRHKNETFLQEVPSSLPSVYLPDQQLIDKLYGVYRTLLAYNLVRWP